MTPTTSRTQERDRLIDANTVGQILSLSSRTVRRQAELGGIAGRKIGGQWRFSRNYILTLRPPGPPDESEQIGKLGDGGKHGQHGHFG